MPSSTDFLNVSSYTGSPQADSPAPAEPTSFLDVSSYGAVPAARAKAPGPDIQLVATSTPQALAEYFDFQDDALVSFFNKNEVEIENDPILKQRVVDTFKTIRQRPFSIGRAIKSFGSGALQVPGEIYKSGEQIAQDIAAGRGERVLQGSIFAGEQLAKLTDDARRNIVEFFSGEPSTDEEWTRELYNQSAWQSALHDAARGKAAVQQATGTEMALTEDDAAAVEVNATLADLTNYIPFGAAIKAVRIAGQIALIGKGGKVITRVAANSARGRIYSMFLAGDKIAAVADKAYERVAKAGRLGTAATLAAAGRGVDFLSRVSAKLPSSGRAIAAYAAATGADVAATGGLASAALALAGPAAAKKIGQSLILTAEKLRGNVPKGPLWRAAAAAVDNTLTRGAATGARGALGLAGDPFALGFSILNFVGADSDQELGQLLGAQVGLGAAAGGTAAVGAKVVPYFDVAGQVLKPHSQPLPQVQSPGYGTNATFDQMHDLATQRLPDTARRAINIFREATRGEAEIYVLPAREFGQTVLALAEERKKSKLTESEVFDTLEGEAGAQGVFTVREGNKKSIFLNSDGSALNHEGGHLLVSLLPDADRSKLHGEVVNRYSPEELDSFRKDYERDLGRKISRQELLDEILAENTSAILNAVPVQQLGTPAPVVRAIYQTVGKFLEDHAGFRTERRTDLGARPDVGLGLLLENAVRETREGAAPQLGPVSAVDLSAVKIQPVVPPGATPTPAAPRTPATAAATGAPAPATGAQAPNIRVTRADQNRFTTPEVAKSNADASAAVDRNPAYTPEQKSAFITVGAVLAQGGTSPSPVEITHRSVKTADVGAGRKQRRAEQEAGYVAEMLGALPSAVRSAFQKLFIPDRFEVRSGDNVQIVAKSVDKILANAHLLAKDATKNKVEASLPYEVAGGKLTEAAWTDLISDIQTYTRNQSNGYAGNGNAVKVPANYTAELPPVNPSYRPVALDDTRAQFINMLMGLAPPVTTARKGVTLSGVPANVEARRLAEANIRPILPSVTSKPGKNFYTDFGVDIAELNPLRDSLARSGVDIRNLIEVTERINLANVTGPVRVRSDVKISPPSTKLVQAGFKPARPAAPDAGTPARTPDEVRAKYPEVFTPERMEAVKETDQRPVEIQSADGSVVPGLWNGYYDLGTRQLASIAYPSDTAWSHGILRPEDKILTDIPSFEEWSGKPATKTTAAFSPERQRPEAALTDLTKEGVPGLLDRSGWALLTAENPDAKPLTAFENRLKNRGLEKDLREAGFDFQPVRGNYGRPENSYFVTGITPEVALDLGRKYGQESVLTPDGLKFADGSPDAPATGVTVFDTRPDSGFTELPDGTFFSVGLDLSNRPSQPSALDNAVGGTIQAVHLSGRSGLKELSPTFFGKGAATPRDTRGLPKTYLFAEGSPLGQDRAIFTSPAGIYKATIDGSKIYDANADALGYWKEVNRESADQNLIDAGFDGFRVVTPDGRDVIATFVDVPVTETKGTLAEGRAELAPEGLAENAPGARETTTAFAPRRRRQADEGTAELGFDIPEQPASRGVDAVRFSTAGIISADRPIAALGVTPEGATDIGRKLADRTRKLAREQGFRFDETTRNDKAKRAMAESIADEIVWAESNLSGETSGRDWYASEVQKAIDTASEKFPELKTNPEELTYFLGILAITSNGQKVIQNAERAVKLYDERRRTGKFDVESSWGGDRSPQINAGLSQLEALYSDLGPARAREFLLREFTVKDLQAQGFKFADELSDTVVNGSAIFGPKVGAAFFQNLHGNFDPFTMDIWFSRTMNRHNGSYGVPRPARVERNLERLRTSLGVGGMPQSNLSDSKLIGWAREREAVTESQFSRGTKSSRTDLERSVGALVKAAEGAYDIPRSPGERAWWRNIFAEVDTVLESRGQDPISNADKQAILWYYEKELYQRLGGRPSDLGVSYSKAMRRAVDSLGSEKKSPGSQQKELDLGDVVMRERR